MSSQSAKRLVLSAVRERSTGTPCRAISKPRRELKHPFVVCANSDMLGYHRGYVQQMDTHLAQTTVREALLFSAKLRQPPTVPLKEKEA